LMCRAGPLRGQVFQADVEGIGPHFWLVVSNNSRNAHLLDVLTAMITSTPPRTPRRIYVPLGLRKGGVSRPTMRLVDIGLAYALSLPRPA
jgi:mRNA-degrading endonuclease toxin of MazEF toxin-antitoxin module